MIESVNELSTLPDDVHVGDVVKITAVDWCMYAKVEPVTRTYPFRIMRADVYGEVVEVSAESVTLAAETFEDGGLRFVRTYPAVTIERVEILAHADDE